MTQRGQHNIDIHYLILDPNHADYAAALAALTARHEAALPGAKIGTYDASGDYILHKVADAQPSWVGTQTWRNCVVNGMSYAGFSPDRIDLTPTPELRMLFAENVANELTGAANIRYNVEQYARAGFNALAWYGWHGDGAMWPSAIVRLKNTGSFVTNHVVGTDDFQILLDECQGYGIKVFFTPTCSKRETTNIHPEWIPVGAGMTANFDVKIDNFRAWLTDAEGYTGTGGAGLMKEILNNYGDHPAFAGMVLDFIRTGDGPYINQGWIDAYAAATGRGAAADNSTIQSFQDNPDLLAVLDSPAIVYPEFIEQYVGDIVRRARRMQNDPNLRQRRIDAGVNPDLLLASYGDPFSTGSLNQGRMPYRWLLEGDIDIAYRNAYQIQGLPVPVPADPDYSWPKFVAEQAALDDLDRGEGYAVLAGTYDTDSQGATTGVRSGQRVSDAIAEQRSNLTLGQGIACYINSYVDDLYGTPAALMAGALKTIVPATFTVQSKASVSPAALNVYSEDLTTIDGRPIVLGDEYVKSSANGHNQFSGTITIPDGTEYILITVLPMISTASNGLSFNAAGSSLGGVAFTTANIVSDVPSTTSNNQPLYGVLEVASPSAFGAQNLTIAYNQSNARCSVAHVRYIKDFGGRGQIISQVTTTVLAAGVTANITPTQAKSLVVGDAAIANAADANAAAPTYGGSVFSGQKNGTTGASSTQISFASGNIEPHDTSAYTWAATFASAAKRSMVAVSLRSASTVDTPAANIVSDVTEFATGTSTGNLDVTFSLGGETPVAVIFWTNLKAAGAGGANMVMMLGCATGATERWCQGAFSEDAQTTTDGSVWGADNRCILIGNLTGTAAYDMQADFVSFAADKCTINITNAPGTSRTIHAMAIAGTGLVAQAAIATLTGALGSKDVVDLDFDPKAIIGANGQNGTSNGIFEAYPWFTFGATDGTSQFASSITGSNGIDTQTAYSKFRTDRWQELTFSGPYISIGFTQFLTNGFRVNLATNTGTPDLRIFYLALGGTGVEAKVITRTMKNSLSPDGVQPQTGIGFPPDAMLFSGVNRTVTADASQLGTPQANYAAMFIGAAASDSDERVCAVSLGVNAASSPSKSKSTSGASVEIATGATPTNEVLADVSKLSTDGWDLTYSAVNLGYWFGALALRKT